MENKKEDKKKIYLTFIVAMVILYGIGYLVGRLIAKGENSGLLENVITFLENNLVKIVPPLFLLLAVASLAVVLILYLSCKKIYKKLQEDSDDDLWDRLENKLNQPIILSNVMMIADLFFFGCIVCISESSSYGKNGGYEAVILTMDIILYVVIFVVNLIISKGVVEIEKSLNPEKRGNVFDFKFNDVWLASCDEAQKLMTYKAGYQAFKNTNITCLILWVIAFLGMLIFKAGIFPLLFVCVIWMVNTLSYQLKAAKLEKKNENL